MLIAYPSGAAADTTPILRYPDTDTAVTTVTDLTVPISEFKQFGPFRGNGDSVITALADAKNLAKETFVLSENL